MDHRRWYDQEPACSRLLSQVREMQQDEMREFCVRLMIHFCDKIKKELHAVSRQSSGMHSLGSTAVTGIYQYGKRSRRWYDRNPVLKQGIGQLYTLPLNGLNTLSAKLGDTFGLLQIYSTVCTQIDQPPETRYMLQIAVTALRVGR